MLYRTFQSVAPLPIPQADGIETRESIALKALIMAYWRVRTWTVAASVDFELTGPAFHNTAADTFSFPLIAAPSTPTDEFELQTVNWSGFTGTPLVYYHYGDATVDVAPSATSAGVGRYSGPKTALLIEGLFNLFTPNWDGKPIYNFRLPVVWADGSNPLTFGATCTGSRTDISPVGLAGYTLASNWSATFTPASWWSWGGKYNTATGVPL